MAFFINSDDFKAGGSSSSGEWVFNRNVRGNWGVTTQHMDDQSYPWLWDGVNIMVLEIHNPMNLLQSVAFEVEIPASIGLLTDVNAIGNQMGAAIQAKIDLIAIEDPYAARTVITAASGDEIVFDFGEDAVDIMWQGIPDIYTSTINVPLGRTSESANELATQFLTVSTTNMIIDPKYLEVFIAESNTQIATTHATKPTLLFSTRDGEYTGQNFTIPRDGNSINIQIKRMLHDFIVPLSGRWYLAFQNQS